MLPYSLRLTFLLSLVEAPCLFVPLIRIEYGVAPMLFLRKSSQAGRADSEFCNHSTNLTRRLVNFFAGQGRNRASRHAGLLHLRTPLEWLGDIVEHPADYNLGR